MGKITRIVYICDLCSAEYNKELKTCSRCKKDYCERCGGSIKIKGTYSKGIVEANLIDYNTEACQECIQKEVDALKNKKPIEVAGQFVLKA